MEALRDNCEKPEYQNILKDLTDVRSTVKDYVAVMMEPCDGTVCGRRHWGGPIEIAIFCILFPTFQITVFLDREN
jgi:hypothetical protein